MNEMKTLRLAEFSYSEAKLRHSGGMELELVGYTEGGKGHKVVLCIGPSTLGYIADMLHQGLAKYQAELDGVRASLRGPEK